MSAACSFVRARLVSYAAEALSSEERRAVRDHLASCGACRQEAAASDASLLFAGMAPSRAEEVSPSDMARILAGVRAGVALRQAERRLAGRARRSRAGAVAAAAAVALFTLALPGGLSKRPAAPDAAAPAAAAPAFSKASAFALTSASASTSAGKPEDEASGATVYEIAPGAGPDEPRVVWIVDRSLDI